MRALAYLRVSTTKQVRRDGSPEGLSIPAQRDIVVRYISTQGWFLVDEYVEPGKSARHTQRPALQEMLRRIDERRDVEAVVMHKFDRFARNAGDHLTIKATLKQLGVRLVSVSEPVEEDPTGKLIEGLLAVLNEHYSDNLAVEVRKGMGQKAKNGGWPHRAPLGYQNIRHKANGHELAYVQLDPERAHLVALAFELYATGEYTLEVLADLLRVRGLTMRERGGRIAPLTGATLHHVLTNKFHMGVVQWGGIEYQGSHEPLVSAEVWHQVQGLLAAASPRGIRHRRHSHYLKGLVFCGTCGRRLSIQVSKKYWWYFYCLGARDARNPTDCRSRFVPVGRIERGVEALYERMQLPEQAADRIRASLEVEIGHRQELRRADAAFYGQRLAKLEDERHKVLEAYYANAIELPLLRAEQERISQEAAEIRGQEAASTAVLTQWQETVEQAIRLATDRARGYAAYDAAARRVLNRTVFERVSFVDGRVTEVAFRPPFDTVMPLLGCGLPLADPPTSPARSIA